MQYVVVIGIEQWPVAIAAVSGEKKGCKIAS